LEGAQLLGELDCKWVTQRRGAHRFRQPFIQLSDNDQHRRLRIVVLPFGAARSQRIKHVQGTTVGDLLRLFGHSSIDFLEVDIEGAERVAFGGACRQWLSATKVLIIELHNRVIAGCFRALRCSCRNGFSPH
jgi:Methyltransferase FkbM domain